MTQIRHTASPRGGGSGHLLDGLLPFSSSPTTRPPPPQEQCGEGRCCCCCCRGRCRSFPHHSQLPPLSNTTVASIMVCSLMVGILATCEYYELTAATADAAGGRFVPSCYPPSASPTVTSAPVAPGNGTGPALHNLLSASVIRDELLAEAPWAESHGSDHDLYLGAGMLYYGFAYAFQAQTIVVLGSGGGFVPRILKQAQRDLCAAGLLSSGGGDLYLVDAHLASAGWGSTFYAENPDTVMRQKYPDIQYLINTTDAAFEVLKRRGITSVDYLHIDADHTFEQSLRDFENYVQLLSPRGVVSFHDTCFDERRRCHTGVPRTVAAIRSRLDAYGLQLVDAHYLYRGVAFALRRSAPALDAPPGARRNFCRTNAGRLSKTSAGFATARGGTLGTLGDFYGCDENATFHNTPHEGVLRGGRG